MIDIFFHCISYIFSSIVIANKYFANRMMFIPDYLSNDKSYDKSYSVNILLFISDTGNETTFPRARRPRINESTKETQSSKKEEEEGP